MPSKNKSVVVQSQPNITFGAVLVSSYIFWVLYRFLFNFPVLFDEAIGKAIFFGIPILIYLNVSRNQEIINSVDLQKLFSGLLRGLAYGGVLGFVALIFFSIKNQKSFFSLPLFITDGFFIELFLAMLTAFWESLFFFGFIQTVFFALLKNKIGKTILFSSITFLIFNLPSIMLRFTGIDIVFMVFLMFLFGFGQSILFSQEKNIYPLIITHTVWGMILLLHF